MTAQADTSSTQTTEAARNPAAAAGAPSWGALAVVLVGTFITVLDYFIANVAVPSIKNDLSASSAQIQLVIIGYGVAFTAGMITCGRLGDMFGRRRIFVAGLMMFTLSSAACGVAPTADALVAFRVVQGVSAALLVPQVLGILGTVYSGAQRGRAFSIYGLVIGLAGVFGQLIGGVLITVDVAGLGWRTVFLLNVPIGLVTLLFIRRVVPESRAPAGARLDLPGAITITMLLVGLVLPLVEGQEQGWPVWCWISLAAAAVLTVVAVVHLRRRAARGEHPLLDPALFRGRTFSVGLVAMTVYFLAMGSFFFLLALYLQQGRGLSPLESGLMFLALGGGYFASSLSAVGLAAHLGTRLVVLGPATIAVGYTLVGVTVAAMGDSSTTLWLIPVLLIAGLGMGMTTGPLTNIVLSGVAPEHAAAASGAANTAQEGGAAIGVAIAGAVFFPALGAAAKVTDYSHAFEIALIPLVAACVAAASIAMLLPKPARA
ncbi:DHA2 family efflux MFS transporter permease subunit [Frankia sp. Ag45/Mut15]|uniref:DHA2 family efflux MFS transporter permease subunit n=1 Tax=Frankia umida TaxID=573489 RepID=A0ABT0K504_9ACTN|nr:DHA2 family efflux MFS transporter permease subunit [Frankia umida]MCK9878848.1 DHA2 family efflux MFS transporter permease subunit [Frankia umida]